MVDGRRDAETGATTMPELKRVVIALDIPSEQLERLQHAFPDVAFDVCPDRDRLPAVMPGAQAMLASGMSSDLLEQSPDLAWVHTYGTGVDALLFPELIESNVVVTNSSGVQASNMAEHLLALMLAFARGLPTLIRNQERSVWTQPLRSQTTDHSEFHEHPTFELGYQTLGIVGLGSVGRALAARAKALGMAVAGIRRSAGPPPDGVDSVYDPSALPEMLAEVDHVVACLPLTPETRGLFGAAEFRAMKPTAFFYNVGRGAQVDQDALIAALKSGEIAGAGLDVTTPEPLPEDSPLWRMPNVLITSHTSGLTPHRWDRVIDLFAENIRRYRAADPFLNQVDKRAGY